MVEFKFEHDIKCHTPANDVTRDYKLELGDTRFRKLLGRKKWNSLPATVRERFSKRAQKGVSYIYKGYILHSRMNGFGRILAQALRFIGGPLPIDNDNKDLAAIVTVTEDNAGKDSFGAANITASMASLRSFTAPNVLRARQG